MIPPETLIYDAVHVHVDNADEIGKSVQPAVRTEEKEPEHFTFATYNIGPAGTQYSDGTPAGYESINLDPNRKSVAIMNLSSQPIVLCHSAAQANNADNYGATLTKPQGALIPAGGSANMDGTGPIWLVNTSTSLTALVSVIQNRRGSA